MPTSPISTTSTRSSSRRDRLSRFFGILPFYDTQCESIADSVRDPWWVFTTVSLFWTIKREYNFKLWELILVSPRFGVMLASMCLSIAFIVVDTCSVLNVFEDSKLPTGVEPFWKVRISVLHLIHSSTPSKGPSNAYNREFLIDTYF